MYQSMPSIELLHLAHKLRTHKLGEIRLALPLSLRMHQLVPSLGLEIAPSPSGDDNPTRNFRATSTTDVGLSAGDHIRGCRTQNLPCILQLGAKRDLLSFSDCWVWAWEVRAELLRNLNKSTGKVSATLRPRMAERTYESIIYQRPFDGDVAWYLRRLTENIFSTKYINHFESRRNVRGRWRGGRT